MNEDKFVNYVLDLCVLIKERALGAKKRKDESVRGPEYDYQLGRLMAYHEVISLIQQQATAFEIPLESIGVHDIDPEQNLL